LWVTPVRFPQKTEKTALGGCRRIGNIKNIACYQQDISLPQRQYIDQPRKKCLMFLITVIPEKGLPKMPVGSMDYFQ
jgi:hypothetical protein